MLRLRQMFSAIIYEQTFKNITVFETNVNTVIYERAVLNNLWTASEIFFNLFKPRAPIRERLWFELNIDDDWNVQIFVEKVLIFEVIKNSTLIEKFASCAALFGGKNVQIS